MIDFSNKLLEVGMTPNGYYVLWCLVNKSPVSGVINEALEKRMLGAKGFLDSSGAPTDIALQVLDLGTEEDRTVKSSNKISFDEFVESYREIFPPGRVKGYTKRDSVQDLKQQFNKWFKVYNFSYDRILEVTRAYVEEEMAKGGKYLKSSYYAIFKRGEPSLLAKLCEQYGQQNGTERVSFNDEL